jgi:catechol 2,3-dioxygenase-like lactoylglutathione lyase family enzyme
MRFQLALNVQNLDEAVHYYSKLLGAPVNKRKPGYANFAVDSPPFKLVLFEDPNATERLNHVGFEMEMDEVEATIARLEPQGLADQVIRDETCCYAEKSTVYSKDPQGLLWEFYKLHGDADELQASIPAQTTASADTQESATCCLETDPTAEKSSGCCG